MSERFTQEQIKGFEKEFKEFLKEKDNTLHTVHTALNEILKNLPNKGILSYTNEDGLVRGELTYEDGSVLYTWYTTEDILGYSLTGAMCGMFGTEERSAVWSLGIMLGVDLREKFIEMVNTCIDIIHEVSEEWEICVK